MTRNSKNEYSKNEYSKNGYEKSEYSKNQKNSRDCNHMKDREMSILRSAEPGAGREG